MSAIKCYLIVDSGGYCRVLSTEPRNLKFNEIAYQLNIQIPAGWGRLAGTININPPNPQIIEGEAFLLPPAPQQ